MNQVFKIKEKGFAEIKKPLLLFIIPIATIAIVVAFSVSIYNGSGKLGSDFSNILPFLLVIVMFCFILIRQINKQKHFFQSLTVTITDTEIVLSKLKMQPISILRNEITAINQNKKGGISIIGQSKTIYIPAQIQDIDKLISLFSRIKPIQKLN